MAEKWDNRIVETGEECPDQLLANPLNWRIHPEFQQKALKGVLDQVGWVQQVIVNQRTGHLIDGHLRVTLAMRHNIETIPVNYVDLSEEEERLILATLDPLSGLAVTDKEAYDNLIVGIEVDDKSLMRLLDGLEIEDYSDFDEKNDQLGGYEDMNINITVPMMHKDTVMEWLAGGEPFTSTGFGKGVLRKCGLL